MLTEANGTVENTLSRGTDAKELSHNSDGINSSCDPSSN